MTKPSTTWKIRLLPKMRVECGDLHWSGQAENFNDALTRAFNYCLPKNPSTLLRLHDGWCWQYIDFIVALRLAGYKVRKTKKGYSVR